MLGIVMASHGRFAKELLSSAEMITGPQEAIEALSMNPEDDPQELRIRIKESIDKVKGEEGAIVLVDLLGGSPGNAAAYFAKDGVPVITGMNLPMLLELIVMRNAFSEDLVDNIIAASKDGIYDLRKYF